METNLNTKIYNADLYLRLSKEDGDKEESDSITNQKELILDYLKSMEDIKIHCIVINIYRYLLFQPFYIWVSPRIQILNIIFLSH